MIGVDLRCIRSEKNSLRREWSLHGYQIAPLEISGASKDKLYYYLAPLIGTGVYYSPVDSGAFMRPVISREEAEALIDAIPGIAPAVCNDSRFNHVDAFL